MSEDAEKPGTNGDRTEDGPSEKSPRRRIIQGMKTALEGTYEMYSGRPEWQKPIIGFSFFVAGVLISPYIRFMIGMVARLPPTILGFFSDIPSLTIDQFLVALIGIVIGQQTRQTVKLRRMEKKLDKRGTSTETEEDSNMASDGGDQSGGLDWVDEDDEELEREESTGGGALGGMIAGAALGSSFGPGGAVGGAIFGAIIGDELEKFADKSHSE